ncbi:MAG: hypothetical protein JWM16_4352, partial [Verrucomicrobiales bacterium]|nr:hypothetical protein [Verrucomicrobiales bacterium]
MKAAEAGHPQAAHELVAIPAPPTAIPPILSQSTAAPEAEPSTPGETYAEGKNVTPQDSFSKKTTSKGSWGRATIGIGAFGLSI